jgi:hypothetical protein
MQQQNENKEEKVKFTNSSMFMLTNQISSYRKTNKDINENESMRNDIIIDSGASKSYFNSVRRLSNAKPLNNHVTLGDKLLLNVYGKDDFGALSDISFAPDLRTSLSSNKIFVSITIF